jgi:hypothetical protein
VIPLHFLTGGLRPAGPPLYLYLHSITDTAARDSPGTHSVV